jgi:hypothetical protein
MTCLDGRWSADRFANAAAAARIASAQLAGELTCQQCGEHFAPHHPKQRFCTRGCKFKHHKRRWKAVRAGRDPVGVVAIPIEERTCIVCGGVFRSNNPRKITCSIPCRGVRNNDCHRFKDLLPEGQAPTELVEVATLLRRTRQEAWKTWIANR